MRRWSSPIPFSGPRQYEIPERPGVFVLLRSVKDPSTVLKIASARSLREAYLRTLNEPAGNWPVAPEGFLFFEAVTETEEATRLLAEYRRKRGERPMYNSGF
jgi:hypothetical protein